MDFGFSLPWGSDAAVFRVSGWRAMIAAIAHHYGEAGTARAAAQQINALPHLAGHGPFRFNESRTDYRFYVDHNVGYYRATELAAPQAISQWYLGSGGTVGFHTITGLSAIHELLTLRDDRQFRFSVWPFEGVDPESHVLVESYPAICPSCDDDPSCKGGDEIDAWKVLQCLVRANDDDGMREWFNLPDYQFGRAEGVTFDQQARFEGLIFGLR